jgi:calcium-dependent protein kinase
MMDIYFDEINDNVEDEFDKYFSLINVIGSGSYGTVIHAIYLDTNEEVAVKVVNKYQNKEKDFSKLKQEVIILKQLKHKNIIEFIHFIETKSKMYIIMEYIQGGTLKDYIELRKRTNNFFTEEEVSVFMRSLLETVNYLHQQEIVHRDIKPENILIKDHNDLSSIKLVDFGLSAQYFEQKEEYAFCGTLIFMAPEQIGKKILLQNNRHLELWDHHVYLT